MSTTLPAPEPALALRLLRPVDHSDRLVGYRVNFRQGAVPVDLLSLGDVLALLQLPDLRLDLVALASWCRGVLHDPGLGQAIAAIAVSPGTPPVHHREVAEILEIRLMQAARHATTVHLVDASPDTPSGELPEPGVHRRSKLG